MNQQHIDVHASTTQNVEPSADHQRLERIESLVVDLHASLKDETLRRQQAAIFYWICAAHILGTWVVLTFVDALETMYVGWYAGMLTTLGVWHGISLRPAIERWKRTLIASGLVSFGSTVQALVDLESLIAFLLPSALLLSGSVGIAGWFVRLAMHRGVQPPEKPVICAGRLSAFSFFVLATWVALAAAALQVIDGEERNTYFIYACFALVFGALAAWSVIRAAEKPSRWWFVRTAIFVPATMVLIYIVLFSLYPDATTGWPDTITQSIGLAAFHLISPVGTSFVLLKNGHRTVAAPSREDDSTAPETSEQIWED